MVYLLAARGDCESQCQIGQRFETGQGLPKNHSLAFDFYMQVCPLRHFYVALKDCLNEILVDYLFKSRLHRKNIRLRAIMQLSVLTLERFVL